MTERLGPTIIREALANEANQPVIRSLCLTSGGGDSTVLAHHCRALYDELVHIDTGTALPGVRPFVEHFAREVVKKPLRIVEAGDAYVRLVLGHEEWWTIFHKHRQGDETPDDFRERVSRLQTREERMALGLHIAPLGFPGPGGHGFAYRGLKERQLERVLREVKGEFGTGNRRQRVVLLTGVRLDESRRRKMTGAAQGEWERRGNQIWISPLMYRTNLEMARYRTRIKLPVSDVTALIHRSGECNCLAFAAKGERDEIVGWFPDWYAEKIAPIEREAHARGLRHWQWGWGAERYLTAAELRDLAELREEQMRYEPMCSSCEAAFVGVVE